MANSGLQAALVENRALLQRFLRARGAAAETDDILQDMWVKLTAMDDGVIGEPLSYLYRMADNHLLDRHRAQTRRTRRETRWGQDKQLEPPSPEETLVARERLEAVERALSDLGKRTHSILIRYRVDGVSQKEIARELGVSLSLVEKHLQRAYRALVAVRRRLQPEEPEASGGTPWGEVDAGS